MTKNDIGNSNMVKDDCCSTIMSSMDLRTMKYLYNSWCYRLSLIELILYTYRRKTFERINRTKERKKPDIRATTCNLFERKFNNPFEREKNIKIQHIVLLNIT